MDSTVPQNIPPQNSNVTQQQIQEQQPVPKRSVLPFILIILFFLVIIAMGGIIFYKHSKIQTQQSTTTIPTATIPQMTSIPSVSPVLEAFTFSKPPFTWKAYTSAAYHYSLKYPPDWKNLIIDSDGEYLSLASPDYNQSNAYSTGVSIGVAVVPTDKKSADAEFLEEENKSVPHFTHPHRTILINGIQAVQYEIGPAQKALPALSTILVTGGYAYHFSIATYSDQKTESRLLSVYNQVLSSFTYIK
jgi:hypothetical protein